MKKVLFTATVDSHILHFHIPYLKLFKENGYEVHVATNGDEKIPYCDVKHKISFERNPIKLNNLKAIKQLKKVIDKEKFDIIHCHTPMGSVVTRLAAKKARKNGTRVIYTAHGFHFYKGASLFNWSIFYPIEKILSNITDDLITINKEDYELALKKFHAKNTYYVPGVGVDKAKFDFAFTSDEKHKLRESLGIKDSDFVIIYVAELNKNKNQKMAIEAIKDLVKKDDKIKLLLVGKDSYNGKYQEMVKELEIDKNAIFTGYRKDIPQLMKISDLAISTSLREGLPVNLIEAMMINLPIVATACRGNKDLVEKYKKGKVIEINDINKLINEIIYIKKNIAKINSLKSKECYRYDLDKIIYKYSGIYGFINNDIKVSIIITMYNSKKYIENCIISVLNQTYKNIEIILVDDGSTDGTYEYVKKCFKDNRVHIYSKTNGGPASAKNYGLSQVSGDYFLFLDSDDWIEANLVEELVKKIIIDDADIVFYDFIMENIYGKNLSYWKLSKYNFYDQKDIIYFHATSKFPSGSHKIISTLLYKKIKACFTERLMVGEELEFSLKILESAKKISFLKDVYYHYVQRDNSQSKSRKKSLYDNAENLKNILITNIYYEKEIINASLMRFKIVEIYNNIVNSNFNWKLLKEIKAIDKKYNALLYGKKINYNYSDNKTRLTSRILKLKLYLFIIFIAKCHIIYKKLIKKPI